MSAREFDHHVTEPVSVRDADPDPLAKLFVDRQTSQGFRIVAVSEPVQHSMQGYLTAAHALAAFEETAVVAIDNDVELGLTRAFHAANLIVRQANRILPPRQRVYAGITAAVIKDGAATIGLVPPGQALLLQDGRIYGVPDLATWRPGFMPPAGADNADPLGWSATIAPILRRTSVGRLDQLLVGASAVGRVLSSQPLTTIADLSATAVLEQLDAGLERAGIDDAFAALVTFDAGVAGADSTDPVRDARLADLERMWRGEPAPVTTSVQIVEPVTEAQRRAHRRAQLHARLIEWSERTFGRDATEQLPLDRGARSAAPPGAGSLDRYTPPRFTILSAASRAVLPRGFQLPIAKRTLSILLVIALLGAILSTGYGVQRAQADRGDRYVAEYKSVLELAEQAETADDAERFLAQAAESLDLAEDHGVDVSVERAALLEMSDARIGITRLAGMTRIGQLPSEINGEKAHLIVAGGRLYLVAGSVFTVDPATQQLQTLLKPGTEVDGLTAGTIIDATVDGENLIATDGRSLFITDGSGRWQAARLANADQPGGWLGTACGAYRGSFYVLDTQGGQIRRFASGRYDEQPDAWLSRDAAQAVESAVDMVVDGSIHILLADGSIQTLFKGELQDEPHRVSGEQEAKPVALYGGATVSFLYVIERVDGKSHLIRYDPESRASSLYLAPVTGVSDHDPAADRAFSAAHEFAIDEATRTVYFLTADSLWQARIG